MYLITGRWNEFSFQKNEGFLQFGGLLIIRSHSLMIYVSITEKKVEDLLRNFVRMNDWKNT